MKEFATNKAGVIKAPHPVQNEPSAKVKIGEDLRSAKSNK